VWTIGWSLRYYWWQAKVDDPHIIHVRIAKRRLVFFLVDSNLCNDT
jgi:hypothetical protein